MGLWCLARTSGVHTAASVAAGASRHRCVFAGAATDAGAEVGFRGLLGGPCSGLVVWRFAGQSCTCVVHLMWPCSVVNTGQCTGALLAAQCGVISSDFVVVPFLCSLLFCMHALVSVYTRVTHTCVPSAHVKHCIQLAAARAIRPVVQALCCGGCCTVLNSPHPCCMWAWAMSPWLWQSRFHSIKC